MFAKNIPVKKNPQVNYQCQGCEELFSVHEGARHCPNCLSKDRSNLIVLYMEDDADRTEWLELVDFSAGD